MFKYAIEATGITGDPAKLVEERTLLADWCYNRPAFPFLMGDSPIVNGMAACDLHLNVIENNQKKWVEAIPTPTCVPSMWDTPSLYREYKYVNGERVKITPEEIAANICP